MRILTPFVCLLSLLSLRNGPVHEPQDYQTYHTLINKAESYISTEQYPEALETYLDVFRAFDFIFQRDYKVAAQLAHSLGDEPTTFEIIKKGMAAGWSLESLKQNEYLSPLQKGPEWELLMAAYPRLRESYLAKIDTETREQIHEMFSQDQKMALGAFLRIGAEAKERYAI